MRNKLGRWSAAAFGGAVIAALATVPGSVVSASTTEVLTTDVLPGIASLTASPLPPSTPVQIGITMSNPHAAAQNAAYQAIHTPGNPRYHQYLSAQEVVAQFGLPKATFAQIVGWATRDGLQAIFAGSTREYLLLQGTAVQAEQTFSVAMNQYTALGKTFYANVNGPTVPAGLDIAGVIGLNSFLASHTFQSGPCATYCTGLTTPQDLWSTYDQPTDLSSSTSNFGQGQQMAVLGEGAVQGPLDDLRKFETEYGLPKIPVTIAAIGDTFSDTSGSEEWDIDSQASTGMAPKAYGETWIFANDLTDSSVETDFAAFELAPQLMEANASFGECEEDPTSAATGGGTGVGGFGGLAGTAGVMFTSESENTLQQATLQGKTLFSSTGDTGSSCPVVYAAVIGAGNGVLNQGYPETNYPASSPYVVAVGGTVLYTTPNSDTPPASNATRAVETAWTHTGGGDTLYIPEPAYQHGIAFLDNTDCLSQPDGTPYASPTPCRGIPDVTAQSGDVVSNGYAITAGGLSDQPGGGTSLASPLWMGMWARVQAATSLTNHGYVTNGFADDSLYQVGQDTGEDPTAFFDVGNETTTSPSTCDGVYCSLPRTTSATVSLPADPSGWDFVSGLGAPDVCNLTKDIDGVSNCDTVTDDVTAPAPRDCGQPGLVACMGQTCTQTSDLWDNPAHVATDLLGNSDPQLTLLKGNIVLSGSTLRVLLTIDNLSETVPTGAAADEWYMLWTYGATTYFANAQVTSPNISGPAYGDGTVTVTGTEHSYNNVNTDTGSFTPGHNGVVEIDVPVANVGNPASGAILQGPSGETDIEVGVPAVGGFLEKVDTGGPNCDYQLGYGAVPPQGGTPAPEVPWTPALLVVGAAGGLVVYRRRRQHSES